MFSDSPEYKERIHKPFVPPQLDYAALRKALPAHLWQRNTFKSLVALTRLIVASTLLHMLGLWLVRGANVPSDFPYAPQQLNRTALKVAGWAFYLWWQPITWTGLWSLGNVHLLPTRVCSTDNGSRTGHEV